MGYSQIYVRINDIFGRKFLLARSFDYNFQERMVSRARGIIEWLDVNKEYVSILTSRNHLDELERIIEVNWDYRTVNVSTDIIKAYIEKPLGNFREFVFDNQENEDGQLFIDLEADYKRKTKKGDPKCIIKYGFFVNYKDDDNENYSNIRKIYGPDEYMQQDFDRNEQVEWRTRPLFQHCLKFTERNINFIEKHAKRMTEEDVLEFMEYDYEKILGAYYKLFY